MKVQIVCMSVGVLGVFTASGCGSDRTGADDGPSGRLAAALSTGSQAHDVTAIHFKVVEGGEPCGSGAIVESIEALQTEGLSAALLAPGAGNAHPFADSLFVLEPGNYTVCATPLDSNGHPSRECEEAAEDAEVTEGATTEIVLVSQCDGDPMGGLDAVLALNDPPRIEALDIDESKFITACEQAGLSVTAHDDNGDELDYDWQIVSAPPGAPGSIRGSGSSVTFIPGAPGDYTINLTVDDGLGATVSQSFPMHVGASCVLASADSSIRTDLDVRANDNHGCQQLIEVGSSRGGGGIAEGDADAIRALVRFDMSGLPEANELESVQLEMTLEPFVEHDPPSLFQLDVHRIIDSGARTPWQEGNGLEFDAFGVLLFDPPAGCVNTDDAEGVAWAAIDANNQAQPDFDPFVFASAEVDSSVAVAGDVVRWDITQLVRGWRDGSVENLGIMLTDVTSDGAFRTVRFAARDAKLRDFPEDTEVPPRWGIYDGPRLIVTRTP